MRALIICAYMGPLPSLMLLWLKTAAANRGIDFLVVSDQPVPAVLPANVRFKTATLTALASHWSAILGFEVALTSPYKLNDFKPLFWSLSDDLERYDYWGYCDLDVLFGDLGPFLDRRMGRYDMILSEGHLRLLRNDERTRQAFRAITSPRAWNDILTDPVNFGMDEHQGINRVFLAKDRSWFADSSQVADIHPSFRQLRRLPHLRNYRVQAFCWDRGHIYHEFYSGGKYHRQEYLYIHLQKRPLPIDPACVAAEAINIDAAGLTVRQAGDADRTAIARRNPWHWPNQAEARITLSMQRQLLMGGPDQFRNIDRPDRGQ